MSSVTTAVFPEPGDAPRLRAGFRLGRYEIAVPVGKGGMGEVYRARDTQLHRDVAVKVLPAEYGADADRLRRFEHEARAMSQVSHANVVAVYDVGEENGIPYLVTELLDGQTLRAVVTAGRLEPMRAVEYAVQIARGLTAAHAKGVIHRDLKPANIFVTRHDEVKILDFGLAKLSHPEWDRSGVQDTTMTAPGLVLGTVSYMAPEQLEGASVDSRTDIFAFGAILYEMLTGARPFEASSPVSLAAAILREQPPHLAAESSLIPPALLPIVRRCLEKSPDARFQSARDLLFALEQQSRSAPRATWSTTTLEMIRSTVARPAVRRGAALSSLTAVLIAVLLLATSGRGPEANEPSAAVERPLVLTRITTSGNVATSAGVSPDAVYVAYAARDGEKSAIRLRHVPSESEVQLLSADWIEGVRISPDRNYIYYSAGNPTSLWRLPLLGGEPRKLVEGIAPSSPVAFSRDGAKIAFVRNGDGVSSVWTASADGSAAHRVAARPSRDVTFDVCAWSPDSARLACSVSMKNPIRAMWLVDATSGKVDERRGFFSRRANAFTAHEWADDDTIVGVTCCFVGAIWKVPLDGRNARRLTNDLAGYSDVTLARNARAIAAAQVNTTFNLWRVRLDDPGRPQLITSGFNVQYGRMGVATLRDGRILFSSNASGKSEDLWISNADGSGRRRLTLDDTSDEVHPKVSADETFIVYLRRSEQSAFELWRADMNGENAIKLTDHAEGPSLTPDGQSVYFTRNDAAGTRLYRIPAAGGEVTMLFDRPCAHVAVSPDGIRAIASCREPKPRTIIFNLDGSGNEISFAGFQRRHVWRPDGKAFAFTGPERFANVMLQPLDGSPARPITSFFDEGWGGYAWTRDGSALIVPRWQSATDVVLLTEKQ